MLLGWVGCCGAFAFIMSSVFMLHVVTTTAVVIFSVIMLSAVVGTWNDLNELFTESFISYCLTL